MVPAFRGIIAIRSNKRLRPSPEARLVLSIKNREAAVAVKRFYLGDAELKKLEQRLISKRGK